MILSHQTLEQSGDCSKKVSQPVQCAATSVIWVAAPESYNLEVKSLGPLVDLELEEQVRLELDSSGDLKLAPSPLDARSDYGSCSGDALMTNSTRTSPRHVFTYYLGFLPDPHPQRPYVGVALR